MSNATKKKIVSMIMTMIILLVVAAVAGILTGCGLYNETQQDIKSTQDAGNKLSGNQKTPTDIDYSLERYNLIKRAYWVNGQREKANSLPCEIQKPLGYIILFTESGAVVGNFVVDGKVSSLNSFLTPDSEYYELVGSVKDNNWLPDVDGSYGENDNGIFFFTTDGKYIEWSGIYLYSDIPFIVENPVVKIGE